MTIEQLCGKCDALCREFNAAAREMNGRELAAHRRRLMMKHNAGFVNGWTVRVCRRVEDVFTVEHTQLWTKTEKGLFGRKTAVQKLHLELSHPCIQDVRIRATASHDEPPANGTRLRVCGEFEAELFLHPEGVQWKSAEFSGKVRFTQI